MSSIEIKSSMLKPETLMFTGRQRYGLDEYVYLKSFNYDDNNSIKVSFYILLKKDDSTFELIKNGSKFEYEYSLNDFNPFKDYNGYNVYKTNEYGEVLYDENNNPIKRLDDYSINFNNFSNFIPFLFKDVINYLGYHLNEGGTLDIRNNKDIIIDYLDDFIEPNIDSKVN